MSDLTLLETEHTTIEQSSGYRIPGYLIVQPKAPCTRVGELSADQASDLFSCISKAESLVLEIIKPGRVYVMKFAEMNPQVQAYLLEVDDKPPINGARMTDWAWMNHESLGHTDAEIETFVAAARDWLDRR
jgi:hypothetical protein